MNPTVVEALGWALVHFVWQGAAIALAAGFINLALRRARPEARHRAVLRGARVDGAGAGDHALPRRAGVASAAGGLSRDGRRAAGRGRSAPRPSRRRPTSSLWLVRIWICGVGISRRRAHWRLCAGATDDDASMRRPRHGSFQTAAARLCSRLDIRRPVRILASALIEVPAAMGWLRPVVLLPVSALTALSSGADRAALGPRARARPPLRLSGQPPCRRWSRRCCSTTRRCGG